MEAKLAVPRKDGNVLFIRLKSGIEVRLLHFVYLSNSLKRSLNFEVVLKCSDFHILALNMVYFQKPDKRDI